jgi:hypothetical protein
MHTIMAIIYGAFLAYLVPVLVAWSAMPTEFAPANHGVVSWLMSFMAVGVFSSGVRDLVAATKILPPSMGESLRAASS